MKSAMQTASALLVRLLSEARQQQNYTMEELAERAEIHRTYIGLLERGERQPTIDVAVRIAEALGLRLSNLLQQVEDEISGTTSGAAAHCVVSPVEIVTSPVPRLIPRRCFRDAGVEALKALTNLGSEMMALAIETTYHTFDLIDEQLLSKGSPRVSQLVELANLSSMLGNLLGAGIAQASNDSYVRNRPHAYPDLIAQVAGLPNLELKTSLESNKPKGHLPKAGTYLTFRYVLTADKGQYTRGKDNRGQIVSIWEVKCGKLSEKDFDISNTEGDSGKTAVIKTKAFETMALVYYDVGLNPYAKDRYPIK